MEEEKFYRFRITDHTVSGVVRAVTIEDAIYILNHIHCYPVKKIEYDKENKVTIYASRQFELEKNPADIVIEAPPVKIVEKDLPNAKNQS